MNIKRLFYSLCFLLCILSALAQETPNEIWQATLGAGDGAVAVADGKVYSLGLFAPDGITTLGREKEPETSEVLICLNSETGDEIWREIVTKKKVQRGHAYEYEHGVPQIRDGRVYVRGAWGTLACYDAQTGEEVWKHDAESLKAKAMDHGYQSSPLLHEGLLITTLCIEGQRRDVRLIAFNTADGTEAWQVSLGTAGRGHWSPPYLGELDGRAQLVVFYNQNLIGMNPKDGSELWRYDAFPIRAEDRTPSTFGHTPEDQNSPIVVGDVIVAEYRHQAHEDMVCDSDYFAVRVQDNKPELLWHSPDFVNWWDSQYVADKLVYGIRREPKGRFGSTQAKYAYRTKDLRAVLECREPATGKALWSQGNLLGPGAEDQFEAATFTITGDRIFIHDEQNLIAGKISPEGYQYLWHREMKGPAAKPVVDSGKLFARSAQTGILKTYLIQK